jgi:hexosaminidase
MKKIKVLAAMGAVMAILLSCSPSGNGEIVPANYEVIPLPSKIVTSEGDPFILSRSVKIIIPEGNEKMRRNAEFLAEFLEISTGIKPGISTGTQENGAIVLATGLQHPNAEAYEMRVDGKSITITGASEAAVFYGIQTLRKSIPADGGQVIFQPVTIKDEPRFSHRGMMLDVARHFQPAEFVKRYIDILALHNLNRFHWHLTDDQGWRIEIKAYPKLTEVGSQRKHTVIGRNSGEFDGKPHGGFYTQDEIREIVQYARERYITVIPEIDLPGHMLSALAAYPELGCTGGPYEVEATWGVFDDVLCPGKEETFTFLERVLSEVIDLFPSEYIHIGGDECPKVRWEKCPHCQARIRELKLKDSNGHTAEHYLQSYVTARIEKFLNEKGRRIIGWDEILEGELAPNATVMSWRGMEGGIQAAQMGHDVIMTPTAYCYFDYYQTQYTDEEPLAIGGYVPIEKVYSFEPAPGILTEEQKAHILGVQANLWTEYIETAEHVDYMVMPRIAALAEVQWVEPEKREYEAFLTRLPRLVGLYDKLGYNYAKHIFDVQANMTPSFETNSLKVELSTIDQAPIYYTLDGSAPTASSTRYDGRISIRENVELRAVAIRENGHNSRILSEQIKASKSSYKPVSLLTTADPTYRFTGEGMLVDGLYGSNTNYKSGKWIGFGGKEVVAVIDMLEPTEITTAEIRNCVVTGDWIFDASEIILEASSDNERFTEVKRQQLVDTNSTHWSDIAVHTLSFDPVTARYYRVTVKPTVMPAWHPGKGRKAYLFIDEIALN